MFNQPSLEKWREHIKETFEETKKAGDEMLILDSPAKNTDYKVLIKQKK